MSPRPVLKRPKRFVINSPTDQLLHRSLIREYIDARRARDAANKVLANLDDFPVGWRRDMERRGADIQLAAAREVIRLASEMVDIIRRY